MAGKAFIIVGGTGAGKSTWIKDRLKKVNKNSLLLYDINAEYKDYYDKPLVSFKKFTEVAARVSNALIVFEEATIFLNNRGSNEILYDILVRKRHSNNTIFLVFHSFRFVPFYIYNLCNAVVIFKTNDAEGFINSRFNDEGLLAAFKEVNNGPKYSNKIHLLY